jgi:hypothetical protein
MAGDQPHLVAELEPVGGIRDAEAAILLGSVLVGGGRLLADKRRTGSERLGQLSTQSSRSSPRDIGRNAGTDKVIVIA